MFVWPFYTDFTVDFKLQGPIIYANYFPLLFGLFLAASWDFGISD